MEILAYGDPVHGRSWKVEIEARMGTVLDVDDLNNAFVMIDGWHHYVCDHISVLSSVDKKGRIKTGSRVRLLVEKDSDRADY